MILPLVIVQHCFSHWPRSCEWATQLHSPRPFPRQVHCIMWPRTSCCLSHLSPTRCITPSLVVHNSSWAMHKTNKNYIKNNKMENQTLRTVCLCLCLFLFFQDAHPPIFSFSHKILCRETWLCNWFLSCKSVSLPWPWNHSSANCSYLSPNCI